MKGCWRGRCRPLFVLSHVSSPEDTRELFKNAMFFFVLCFFNKFLLALAERMGESGVLNWIQGNQEK